VTILLWFWLGGIVGQAALTATNDDAARGLKRATQRTGTSALVGYLFGLALWPLTILVMLAVKQRLIRHIDKQQETQIIELTCRICGLKDEARIASKRWLQDPPYWYADMQDPDAIYCSYACAKHATYHERKE
jgi:hypothetical protein